MKSTTYIFGHKNPDTDSVVSAVAFERLKHLLGETEYKAARAGNLSPQTEYIFKRFNVTPPEFIPDMTPKVKYYMNENFVSVNEKLSLWSAAGKMQKNDHKALCIVDDGGKYKSLLHYNVFAKNMLSILNPEHHLSVRTSISLIKETLNAQPLNLSDEDEVVKTTMIVGAASFESFKKTLEAHLSERVIVITGDRDEIHRFCVEKKIHGLIVTGGKLPQKDIIEGARASGISVLISTFDTASTAMLFSYSSPVSVMSDYDIKAVNPMDEVSKIKPALHKSPSHSLPVVDDAGVLVGIISENDLIQEPKVQISLVDHNELSQAVEGIENYKIREIIDHHKIGAVSTKYPITFINRPVGSTSTQIANMFREHKVSIPLDTAQILLCGILSDTLVLQSATTTDIDRKTATYLSGIADLDIQKLGKEIIAAGSHIGNRTAGDVINQDMKEYKEGKIAYTASQIEIDDPFEILGRKEEFLDELEIIRRAHAGLFSVLLITDITNLSSYMLIASDEKFVPFIGFPKTEENVYYLKDIVSRKKQLIPLLTEAIEHFST